MNDNMKMHIFYDDMKKHTWFLCFFYSM